MKKFDPNKLVQPVLKAISEAVTGLDHTQTIEVLEHVAGHCDGMIEGEKSEMDDDE